MASPAVQPMKALRYGRAIAVVVPLSAVAAFVQYQLGNSSRTYDRMFAQYQSPESEASRQRVFGDMGRADPRKSVFNVLSWAK